MAVAMIESRNEINTSVPTADEWITTNEAAQILGRSRGCVTRLVKQGVLPINRPGRCHIRFLRSEVVDFARKSGVRV